MAIVVRPKTTRSRDAWDYVQESTLCPCVDVAQLSWTVKYVKAILWFQLTAYLLVCKFLCCPFIYAYM